MHLKSKEIKTMEIQLDELIAQIKKDGVSEAQNEAEKIIAQAEAEAEEIVSKAKAQAEDIIAKAKAEGERFARASEDSVRQAGRNLLLSFRESVAKELEAVIGKETEGAYSAELIAAATEAWAKNTDTDDLTLLLNQKDIDTLEASLLSLLRDRLSGGVTLTPSDSFAGGFRILSNDKNIYYDYSKDAVVDMLSQYLSPRVAALMKEAEAE